MSIAPTLRGASRRAAQAALAASRSRAPGGDQILPRALLHRAIRPNNCDEGPRGFTDGAAVARRTLASMSAPLLAEVAPIDPPAPVKPPPPGFGFGPLPQRAGPPSTSAEGGAA